MPYLIGTVVALAVSAYATTLRLDRDRAFYPTVLIVVAAYYVLFAAMGGSGRVVFIECMIMGAFAVAATLGFQRSLWLVVAGLAAHGIQDSFHTRLIANAGVPDWWPAFCLSYDVVAAAYLAWRLTRRSSSVLVGA